MKCLIKLFTIFMVSLFFVPNLQSQDEKVILYNRTPVKVEIANDKIVSFVGNAPDGYMAGYDLTTNSKLAVIPSDPKDELVGLTEKNAEYSIIDKERIFLNYKPGYAILDKSIITELNMISFKMRLDTESTVLLTAHVSDNSGTVDKLSRNRLDAVLSYLKIKGIGPERTKIEFINGPAMADKVAVSFLR